MRKSLLIIALIFLAAPARATSYFIAPASLGGSDSNNGTSTGTPWLTPNHAINCGDTVTGAASTIYAEANFRIGSFGTVTCPGNNNVAWLKCVTFDACKITISNAGAFDALTPGTSYWGVQGWEIIVTAASTNGCFEAYPATSAAGIHHIIFANNVANGCGDGCFFTGKNGSVGVDYLVIMGNICYNGAQDTANSYSGIDIVSPVTHDTLPGTHYYVAGNYTWGNVNPPGSSQTDGEGILFDTLAGALGVQFVAENNISVFNGGFGFQSYSNTTAPTNLIYARQNTFYGNQTGGINNTTCSEMNLNQSYTGQIFLNLVQTTAANACAGPVGYYALAAVSPNATDMLYNNYIYSAAGNFVTGAGPGFAFGPGNTIPTTAVSVTGQTVGTARNDYTGCVGFNFTSPSSNPPTVSALGRWTVSGNTATHTIYFGTIISGTYATVASVTVYTSGQPVASYQYGPITPVTLTPSTVYVVLSCESNGGDQFYNNDTTVTFNSAYGSSEGNAFSNIGLFPSTVTIGGTAGTSFGPVNFLVQTGSVTSPAFANPVEPPAPNCGGFSSVPACAATMIANFTPTNAAAKAYGYQPISSTPVYDPLYPQWLATVTLPAGLVTPGTVLGTSIQGATLKSGSIH